nr:MAG TPA: hypothetical protein [Caudoviricetes sp.]
MSFHFGEVEFKHLIHLVDKLLNNFPADIWIIHLSIHQMVDDITLIIIPKVHVE